MEGAPAAGRLLDVQILLAQLDGIEARWQSVAVAPAPEGGWPIRGLDFGRRLDDS